MNKAEATQIMREIEAASDSVFAAHGLKRKSVRASYDAGEINVRIVAQATDPALDPKRLNWNRYAEAFGLPVDALGLTFTTSKGVTYKITGLDPNRRKYPVTIVDIKTGKDALYTVEGIEKVVALGLLK